MIPDRDLDSSYPWQVPLNTCLFRGVGLDQALNYVYSRNEKGARLRVISAPCSTGAEVDSVAALHNQSGFGGQLEITGYDIHPSAISHARKGRYFIPVVEEDPDSIHEVIDQLRLFGFASEGTGPRPLPEEEFTPDITRYQDEEESCYMITSDPVREPHEVSFEERDLGEGSPPVCDVDLALANNFFYHLHPDEATLAAVHLAQTLGREGALSIGGLKSARFRKMGVPGNYSEVRYSSWLSHIVKLLGREFGLTPKTPIDYVRPAYLLAR